MPSTPSQSTPLRLSIRRTSSFIEESIVVDTIPQALKPSKATQDITNTPPSKTPKTRKRKIDFKSLYNYRFQGPPLISLKLSPPTKKARAIAPKKPQNSS